MQSECFLTHAPPVRRRRHLVLLIVAALVGVTAMAGIWLEVRYSPLQAYFFSGLARDVGWEVQPGANADLWLPHSGPYDSRLGYSRMAEMLPRLQAAGYG